jgi:hypothetical protein
MSLASNKEGNSQSVGIDQGRVIILSISLLKLSKMLSNCLAGTIDLFSSSCFLSFDELIELCEVEILFEAFDCSARQSIA